MRNRHGFLILFFEQKYFCADRNIFFFSYIFKHNSNPIPIKIFVINRFYLLDSENFRC